MASTVDNTKPGYERDNEESFAEKKAEEPGPGGVLEQDGFRNTEETSVHSGEDILGQENVDPVLTMKMHLVNNAIDEIGWTPYHLKLFFLNGFGYAVDSMILLFQSVISTSAYMEFGSKGYANGLDLAVYVGMLTGAIFWGFSADIIGRRFAFNVSLFICSISCIIAGAMPSWAGLGVFIALLGFGGGGNLVMDTTVFLEYLPGRSQWLLTILAAWWGVGQAITGFIAWGFLVPEKWNCSSATDCTMANNWGWRYCMFTGGAIVFVMSALRITIIRLKETPKYLLGMGEDAQLIETLQYLSTKYNRHCSLTLEKLEACGTVRSAHSDKGRFSFTESWMHVRGLFSTKKMALTTSMVWFSWALIGLAYPLFYVFLPVYLKEHGHTFDADASPFITWRNYALANVSGIPGPIIGGYMANTKLLGRRYTMTIGALITMVFFFAYTAVATAAENVAFTCLIGCFLNVYYGTLYAYTPEVLPSAHRATGNGVAVACNRIMGILSSIIATEANTATSAPIYLCAALFVVLAIVSALFPFEPYGRRSS